MISQNVKQGFLNTKIFCPFDKDEFDFILYICVSQKRLCDLSFETNYDKKCISISDLNKTSFIDSTEIKINVKLLKREETNMKIKARIDNKINEIDIIFTHKNKCYNFGYKLIKNEVGIIDNSDYFAFTLNELSAKGMEINDEPKMVSSKRKKKKFEVIATEYLNITNDIKIEEINTKINLNINDIVKFYSKISEEARLIPIYCRIIKMKNHQQIIRN